MTRTHLLALSLALSLAVAALAGCATSGADYQPIIDTKGVNQAQYQTDLSECQAISQQTQPASSAAGKDAAFGAAVGAVIGAIGGNSRDAAQSAGLGAVAGGLSGGGTAVAERKTVLRNCLRGRGYRLLN